MRSSPDEIPPLELDGDNVLNHQ